MTLTTSTSPHAFPNISGYRIVEKLYLGSRTAVYRAIQMATQQPVVIKMLRRDYPSFGELVQFRNQYTIAKNLPIPGIVQPLSLEPLGSSDALVMEDCGGIALGKYIQQQSLDLTAVLAIAIQIADILHNLCQHRVVHKDIKPANVLIHPESKQVKLIDFSIASLLPKETQEIQSPNILEGTLAYLAPEQTGRMNRGIDYRADFYALGVTLYQLLTGTLPFCSDNPLELVHCHIAKMPMPVDQVKTDVPAIVAAIVAKLMAKNAEDRYQSALGLKHDLQRCLTEWEETGRIATFELGQRDLSDRFNISEKLYGRETEVQTLLKAFDRVAAGASELMLVDGISGIGKTAVVNEVHKPIASKRGYFIKGKFDQFNRNIPFSAFVQAFRDLMGQFLGESDAALAIWRAKILGVLGESGQVILEVISELERIIGKQPPVPELSGSAAQNRFNLLFSQFIGVLATQKHPLVIFLDDLQWADSASLNLLTLLADQSASSYLLILGTYRDNEVFPAHPLMLTLADIRKQGMPLSTLTLGPLSQVDITHLVADTLRCSPETAMPLAQLVFQKTQGNSFFTTQFLQGLYAEGCISFDQNAGYWQCDLVRVQHLMLTDDVVAFMVRRLQKLPPATQDVLQLAACIGNHFDLETLAIVCDRTPNEVATDLWCALQEGLVVPHGETYKFFQGDEGKPSHLEHLAVDYRFLHDRVQQAAYSLISQSQKQSTHLRIGQLILQGTSPETSDDKIYTIVNQLNIGAALISEREERQELAQLNLTAGRRAKLSTAYGSASHYFATGIELLSTDSWSSQYDLTLSLYWEQAETLYLNGDFNDSEKLIEIALAQTKSIIEKAKIYNLRIIQHTMLGRYEDAICIGRNALSLLSVDIGESNVRSDLAAELEAVRIHLDNRPILSLVDAPLMTDPVKGMMIKLLSNLGAAAYFKDKVFYELIGVKIVNLSLQYGHTEESTRGYYIYAILLASSMQDYQTAYQVGLLAFQLSERLKSQSQKCKACNGLNHLTHWVKPMAEMLPTCNEGFQAGLESGELQFAGYILMHKTYIPFSQGANLEVILAESRPFLQFCQKANNQVAADTIQGVQLLLSNLTGKTDNPASFDVEGQTEAEYFLACQSRSSSYSICRYLIAKSQILYLYNRPADGISSILEAEKLIDSIAGNISIVEHNFYHSLCLAALYKNFSHEGKELCMKQLYRNQKQLKVWAENCPENYSHKYLLITAEIFRISGQTVAAIEHYERAISNAKAQAFTQDEAITNELMAKLYLESGEEKMAQDYLISAYYGYAHWGARTKVEDLEWRYPALLAPILQQQQISLSATETVVAPASLTPFQTPSSHSSTSGHTSISATLDLATILKASQALSSEIQLDKLLATLLHTVLENAGADKGALLMPQESQWFVEAVAIVDYPARVQSVALSSRSEVPHSLIHTVKRSLQPMVVVDAVTHPTLATDTYVVQQQPKSLLCTPILQQGKLLAILYLENRLTVGAFTSDRVELLNFLCAQAAISLENARLYQQAQTYTQQLEQSQLQIVQSEKMASLGNLVSGVAHEINNPIGFLNGSIDHSKDYVQDLLGHLRLYQHHYPNPVAPIQDNAEDIDLEYLIEDLPNLLESMNDATHRIKGISASLRTFSRADTENKINANIHEGIDSTILILKYRLKANEHRPAIEVLQDYGKIPTIDCFPGQLNQVFMNILANAIDLFDETAQTQSLEDLKANPQKITICTTVEAKHVLIQIRDNGKGMTEEVQAKIFDHLFTTKGVGKGTGLGLAIARQIVVENHGGSLDVRSELDQGTEFCIRLPMAA